MKSKLLTIKKEEYDPSKYEPAEGGEYPHGTELRFEDDSAETLGFEMLEVGDEISLQAVAIISEKSEEVDGDKKLCIQITALKLVKPDDTLSVLYPESKDSGDK